MNGFLYVYVKTCTCARNMHVGLHVLILVTDGRTDKLYRVQEAPKHLHELGLRL